MRRLNAKLSSIWLLTAFCFLFSPTVSFSVERIQLPEFSLEDHQGTTYNIKDYVGKVVMVNFWATWCPPCIEEFPSMQALKASLSDQNFELLAINMGDNAAAISEFADSLETEINFPLLLDETMDVVNNWRVRGLPTTIIVDKTGRVAFFETGPRDWFSDEMREKIAGFIAE